MSDDAVLGTGLFGVLDRTLRLLELVAILVAAAFLLIAMVLMTVDAGARYLFNSPLSFQLTLTEDYLLVGLIMMALPWGFRTGGYIRIAGLPNLLPPAARDLVFRIGLLISAGYAALLCWQSWVVFWKIFLDGDKKMGAIDFPIWLSHVWVPTGLGLLTLRLLLTTFGPKANLHVEHDPIEEV